MKYLIYKHTLIANCDSFGKSYIGYTHFNDPNLRWQSGKGYYKQTQPCFRDAIKKYGWENFEHIILETNINSIEQAKERERYWIAYYHTYIKDSKAWGYNLTPGGDDHTYNGYGCYQMLEDKTIVAKYASLIEAEDNTGISSKNIYKACAKTILSAGGYYWCYIKDYDTYQIKKSIKLISKKAVIQLDLENNVISIFDTMTKAAIAVNGSSSKICLCCKGKRKTAYGYKWRYVDEERKSKN